ncbi:hypothetical protein [Herbaspirillum sp. B65]|uniref:hypothetical protein n=1 Tax=Herbaspirillum sp. B65 TaxID=137708 RepID=UPI00131F1698|nr:hypothetical protein [Herbaspirillum sp. B65]
MTYQPHETVKKVHAIQPERATERRRSPMAGRRQMTRPLRGVAGTMPGERLCVLSSGQVAMLVLGSILPRKVRGFSTQQMQCTARHKKMMGKRDENGT